MNFLLISIIESIYVIYILNYFKTSYSLAHPLTYFENKILYHPIGTSSKPICNICKLGNYGAFLIAFFILTRYVILQKTKNNNTRKSLKLFSIFFVSGVLLLSFLNMNAVVYLIPYFITEYYLIRNNFNV